MTRVCRKAWRAASGEGVAHAAQTLAEVVLAMLAARGVAVGDAERARILDEGDLARLGRWRVEAATCVGAHELWAMTDRVCPGACSQSPTRDVAPPPTQTLQPGSRSVYCYGYGIRRRGGK